MLRQPKIEPPGGVGRRSQRQSEGEENQFVLYLGNKNVMYLNIPATVKHTLPNESHLIACGITYVCCL